jgi:tetratricopeptide (TPR) repeat protein
VFSVPALSCIWDSDTIAMERARFPSALELITGKFARHSREFYEWRIRDRERRIAAEPANLALYDDLAAAYDKIGNPRKAIEIMRSILDRDPGRYETQANLGTFYLHDGETGAGLQHIELALKINPDAHFGREKYQKLLAEYLQARRRSTPQGEPLLPLEREGETFAQFIKVIDHPYREMNLGRPPGGERLDEIRAAVKGVLGILRFGNHESPVVLEALGDLLRAPPGLEEDAALLAARAYLKASMHAPDAAGKVRYRKKALALLQQHESTKGDRFEAAFQQELADARGWYLEVEANERKWIAAGTNPEIEFERVYYKEPLVAGDIGSGGDAWKVFAWVFAVAFVASGAWAFLRWRPHV